MLQKGLKVHLRQTSGGGVLPVMVCPAMRHMCRTPRSAVAVGHVGEAESTSAASMQLGNGWRLSVTSRTSPSSCRNRAAGTWAAHMPSGPRVGPRASMILCGHTVPEAECRRNQPEGPNEEPCGSMHRNWSPQWHVVLHARKCDVPVLAHEHMRARGGHFYPPPPQPQNKATRGRPGPAGDGPGGRHAPGRAGAAAGARN